MAQTLEHNEVITQVVPITVPSCDVDVTVIQQLDDEPNDVGGLTAAELKAKFDETNAAVKRYINDELIPSVVGADATEQARAAAEAERVANEIERVSNETTRVNAETTRGNNETSRQSAEITRGNNETARQSAETTRGNNETTRVSNETIRQNNEAARVLAEAARENAETGYVAQCATSAQDAANSATAARNSATAASNSETAAGNSATAASNSATAAGNSAMNAAKSERNAAASEAAASSAAIAAEESASDAGNAALNAGQSEQNAEESAQDAEAWAVGKRGGVNVGEGDPAYHNNALYWKEQAQQAAGAGDMLAATYDPQGKEQDIFAYIDNAISGVTVTTDETPTQGSTNPVQSGGVYTALANKLDKTGDGSNVTAAFTAASSRTNIATGEKLSVLFGKIAKWFSDLGSLAFKSTVAKTDLASAVQSSLDLADTALQSLPSHNHDASAIISGILPVIRGGTGVSSLDELATALGAARIQTGSYTGTGTYGQSNPCSLTFNFVPKFVLIILDGHINSQYLNIPSIAFYGQTTGLSIDNEPGTGWMTCTMTWNNKRLSWYAANQDVQRNRQSKKYYWAAFA